LCRKVFDTGICGVPHLVVSSEKEAFFVGSFDVTLSSFPSKNLSKMKAPISTVSLAMLASRSWMYSVASSTSSSSTGSSLGTISAVFASVFSVTPASGG
jgi:hypothetical protein